MIIIIHAVRDHNDIINDSNVNIDHFETLEFGQYDGVSPEHNNYYCYAAYLAKRALARASRILQPPENSLR